MHKGVNILENQRICNWLFYDLHLICIEVKKLEITKKQKNI